MRPTNSSSLLNDIQSSSSTRKAPFRRRTIEVQCPPSKLDLLKPPTVTETKLDKSISLCTKRCTKSDENKIPMQKNETCDLSRATAVHHNRQTIAMTHPTSKNEEAIGTANDIKKKVRRRHNRCRRHTMECEPSSDLKASKKAIDTTKETKKVRRKHNHCRRHTMECQPASALNKVSGEAIDSTKDTKKVTRRNNCCRRHTMEYQPSSTLKVLILKKLVACKGQPNKNVEPHSRNKPLSVGQARLVKLLQSNEGSKKNCNPESTSSSSKDSSTCAISSHTSQISLSKESTTLKKGNNYRHFQQPRRRSDKHKKRIPPFNPHKVATSNNNILGNPITFQNEKNVVGVIIYLIRSILFRAVLLGLLYLYLLIRLNST